MKNNNLRAKVREFVNDWTLRCGERIAEVDHSVEGYEHRKEECLECLMVNFIETEHLIGLYKEWADASLDTISLANESLREGKSR